MANELAAANAYFDTLLKGNSDLTDRVTARIYADFAPSAQGSDPIYPLVIYSMQSTQDSLGIGAERLLTNPLFLVCGIAKGGYGEVSDIADLIDAILHKSEASITVGGATYFIVCYRERAYQDSRSEKGVRYTKRGGLYRLNIQRSA